MHHPHHLLTQPHSAKSISQCNPRSCQMPAHITYPFKHQWHLQQHNPKQQRSIQATRSGPNRTTQLRFVQYNTTSLSRPALAHRQSMILTPRGPSFHLLCLTGGALVSMTGPMPRNTPTSDHPCTSQNDINPAVWYFFLSYVRACIYSSEYYSWLMPSSQAHHYDWIKTYYLAADIVTADRNILKWVLLEEHKVLMISCRLNIQTISIWVPLFLFLLCLYSLAFLSHHTATITDRHNMTQTWVWW